MLITKGQGLNDILDSGNRYGFTFDYDNAKNVYVYHGTSQDAADKIEKEGRFHDGFFFHSEDSFDSESNNYAQIRSNQKGETSGGVILKFLVDPRCLLVNGAGETESDGDLYKDTDGVWKTEPYLIKNLPNMVIKTRDDFDADLFEELPYAILSDEFCAWIYNTFYYYFTTDKLGEHGSIEKLLEDIEYYYDISLTYKMESSSFPIDDYLTIEDYIEHILETDDSYDDEDDVRNYNESEIDAITYNLFAIDVSMDATKLSDILYELDDTIINTDLFIVYLNESRRILPFNMFVEKKELK